MPSLRAKTSLKTTSWYLSNAFGCLFKSYAQAFNKRYSRIGGLFEEPFHRIEIDNNVHFVKVLWYIHYNPQKHGFVKDLS
jgi:putative transposase